MFNEGFADATALRKSSIAVVAHALQSLSVPPAEVDQIEADLVAGADTLPFEVLGLDSLGAMEFCIYLELELGLVVQPEELINVHFAEDLLCLLESRLLNRSKDAQGDS